MRRFACWLFLFYLGAAASFCVSKTEDPSLLTLDRIFNSREFNPQRFGPARWLKDGSGYTTVESASGFPNGQDIVLYDPETGRREVLIPSKHLIPSGEKTPLRVSGYDWSSDGKKLLIFTNTQRVWRQNTRGDYWVLDLQSWELRKLGGEAEPSSLMFAKFAPDGQRAAYVFKNNLYVEDLGSGRVIPLTFDGSELVVNGSGDWVYEEEFSLRDGFRWSPNGEHIAYWQLDTQGVPVFYLINNTDALYPRLTPIRYPKAGEMNPACRVGVVSSHGGETIWMNVPGDARDNYIPRMDWAAGDEGISFQRLNRMQNTNRVMVGDVRTGEVRTILTEKDEAWVDVIDDMQWLGHGKDFIWVSERDGWRHVYLAGRTGDSLRPVTRGKFDVLSVEGVDEQDGWLYFTASPQNPTQRFLYRTRLDGRGSPERLTPPGQGGSHSYQVSPGCHWAFHTYSSFDTPPVTELVRLPGHEVLRVLVDNSALIQKVKALKRRPVEFFRVDVGGVELDGWCQKPWDLQPDKRYPVLFYVYGEPAGSTVRDSWGGTRYLWHLFLTQQGYLVMSVDNRGTNVPRGREWRKSIYRQVGILASSDQARAVREIIDRWNYVDPERVGIWGWSGGGSMSLNAIFRYPELYRTAMAVAPVSSQRFYDSIYQERYMGLPQDNEEGYKNGSPITYARKLEGNLLIVHGTGDDNVHYQSAEALVNELVKHNKRFSFMPYPNRSHGIYEGEGTTRHLYGTLTWYLEENLPSGPRDR